jgi:hypothetical protein
MERLWVDPRAQAYCHALGLNTQAAFLRLMGEARTGDETVRVVQRALPSPGGAQLEVFCKQYIYPSASWRFWGRASKARREFENYALFESLGIRCARRLICLESRDAFGRLTAAFLMTEAVPDSLTLEEFVRRPAKDFPLAALRRTRMVLCRQLAGMTRALHQAGGFHNDLYWRNVLVQGAYSETPTLWWIDCPRGGFLRQPFVRPRKQIKDLAALDMESTGHCRSTERLCFLKAYVGVEKLDDRVRILARRIHTYRRQRWPAKG